MLILLSGLILLFIPFLLVNRFKEKKQGFFYILSGIIFFALFSSIITQALHIFTYNIILAIYVILDIIILFYSHKKDNRFKELKNNIKNIKIDWMLVFIIILLFISIYSVHYNYSGKISNINEAGIDVNNAKLIYPYYSDEWVSVSLIKSSIESNSLPLANPLTREHKFLNFELASHSFLSILFLLTGLNPLTYYSVLSLFISILICIIIYFILRFNNIDRINSGVAAIFALYITNGVNLPGLWYLLPFTIGLLNLMLGFIFISLDDKKMSIFMSFLILVFYPPLFVFYSISLITYLIFANSPRTQKSKYLGIYLGICTFVALILILILSLKNNISFVLSIVFDRLFYETFTKGAIPDYSIWKVIPFPIIVLSFIGIIAYLRKKIVFSTTVFVGLIYWILYSFVLWRVIIEYQRAVVTTSILLIIFAGFGLQYLIDFLKDNKYLKTYNFKFIIQMTLLIFLFILSFNYTKMNNWQELKLRDLSNNQYISPASPATNYLVDDDLRIFRDIKNKTFLSLPWKGLVIGVATHNYPIETKSSIITNRIALYSDFMDADCKNKIAFIKKYNIDYVYAPNLNCTEGFELIDKSNEVLFLYKLKSG